MWGKLGDVCLPQTFHGHVQIARIVVNRDPGSVLLHCTVLARPPIKARRPNKGRQAHDELEALGPSGWKSYFGPIGPVLIC
jgi:hypothetical protein